MEQYKDQLLTFLQDRWFLVALAIIAIIIIIKVVKSVVKWLLILGLAAAVIIYGSSYTGEIKDTLKEIGEKITNYSKEEAVKAMVGEADSATYEVSQDGSFVVKAGMFTLEGSAGSKEATLIVLKQSFNVKLDNALLEFVEGVKSRQVD